MENNQVIAVLKECGSLLDGHFLLSSGKHSNRYCQCAKLLQYPNKAATVTAFIAKQLVQIPVDVVVGPAMGGVVVGYELARQIGAQNMFTERVEGEMTFRRGFELAPGMQILIAEDVVTTGKSTLETVKAIESFGAQVVGLACIVDRRAAGVELPFPVYAATTLTVETFDANSCPLCAKNIPIVQPGSRKMK